MTAYGRRKRAMALHRNNGRFLTRVELKEDQDEMFNRVIRSMIRHDGEPIALEDCGIDKRTRDEREAGYPPGWGEEYGAQYDPRIP